MKGQVALEYLSTYGWVILGLGIVIALVVGSGAFAVSGYTKDYYLFPPQITVKTYYLLSTGGSNGELHLTLINNFGYKVRVDDIKITDKLGNSLTIDKPPLSHDWERGEEMEIATKQTKISEGINKFNVEISYEPCNDGVCASTSYTIKGTLYLRPVKSSGMSGSRP